MSKISYLLIGIMLTALLFMGAVRGYQFYANKAQAWEEERQEQADAQFSFQQVPLSLAAPQAEVAQPARILPAQVTSMNILPISSPDKSALIENPELPPHTAVFLEDVPLSGEQAVTQAQDTLNSIVRDYKNDPNIKAFNKELSTVTQGQAADLSALGGGDLKQFLRDNPQIQSVISKHMQNPDFARKVQEILSNPQFIQSVEQLKNRPVPARKK